MARSDGGRQLLCLLAVVPAALAFNILPAHMLSAPHARGMALPRGMVVPGGLPPSLRTRRPALRAKGRSSLERDDPEYKAVLARQKLLTEAMDVLTQYDEAQADFQALYADSNAPLGDWCGYHRRLTAAEREQMRDACRLLAGEARYVLIGLNAADLAGAHMAMSQWLAGLGLPEPSHVPYTDDTLRQDYAGISEMPRELQQLFSGPIHMCYNSKADADEETGDDTGALPAAHCMPYPAGDRGVVFTPILDGFFTQYGDIPLDLFDDAMDASAPTADQAAAEVVTRNQEADPDIATKQHAALGNPMAAKALADKEGAAPGGRQGADSIVDGLEPPQDPLQGSGGVVDT